MRAVIQRSGPASVVIDGETSGEIDHGLVVLVGIEDEDTNEDIEWLSRKICSLRIFNDDEGKMNRDIKDTGGDILVVSQFTLADPVYAVLWKGFNILFLIVALHHGFYGLNNVMTDYIRNPMGRLVARALSWTVALGLLIIGLYSVITAGW